MSTDAVLRFDNVTFAYRQTAIFSGFAFSMNAGEMTAVLGPNGSGKTTLVRLAAGSLAPSAGVVLLSGRDLGGIPAAERARIVAVVPQETRLAFDFTVREVVSMGRAPHLGLLGLETGRDREIVDEAMMHTDVADLASRRFLTLSGGERQRVIIARTLAQQPSVLLLDEPTAFLDLRHRLAAYALLTELNRERGLTVVVVSHDINLAARHCSRLVLLDRGRIHADGPPGEVLTPEHVAEVYGVEAEVRTDHPTGRPYIFPLRPSP
jgi:iron complex transport system ATP-binding protein